jgi:hypothetical protein
MGSCERGGGVGGLRLQYIRQVQRERAAIAEKHATMIYAIGTRRGGIVTCASYNDYVINIHRRWGVPRKARILNYLPVGPLRDEPMQESLDQTPGIIKIINLKL